MAPVEVISEAAVESDHDIGVKRAFASGDVRNTCDAPLRVYLVLALGIVCIALSAIFTRLSGVPGTVSAFYRVAIMVAALAPLFARQVASREVSTDRRVWLLAACAGVFFALDLALWNTSLFLTTAADATLLGNDAPILVGLIALLVF